MPPARSNAPRQSPPEAPSAHCALAPAPIQRAPDLHRPHRRRIALGAIEHPMVWALAESPPMAHPRRGAPTTRPAPRARPRRTAHGVHVPRARRLHRLAPRGSKSIDVLVHPLDAGTSLRPSPALARCAADEHAEHMGREGTLRSDSGSGGARRGSRRGWGRSGWHNGRRGPSSRSWGVSWPVGMVQATRSPCRRCEGVGELES